jgi:CspA family cold shock protein
MRRPPTLRLHRNPKPPEDEMATGIVRFYNDSKGFGLITPDIAGPTLFAHSADLKAGVKKLKALQRVEFDIRDSPNGASAANIRMLA